MAIEIVWSLVFLALAFGAVEYARLFGGRSWSWLRFPLAALLASTGLIVWLHMSLAITGLVFTLLFFLASALFSGSVRLAPRK